MTTSSSRRLGLLLAVVATVGVGGCAAGGPSPAGPVHAGPAGGHGPARFAPLGGNPRSAVQVLGDPRPGVPTVERQRHDGIEFTLAVSPGRPGWNLVRVDAAPVGADGHEHGRHGHGTAAEQPLRVGTDPDHLRPAGARPGTDGAWVRLRLPAGAGLVYVGHGPEHRLPFPVDTGRPATGAARVTAAATGPDGPECAAAAVGTLLAGARPAAGCPAGALTEADAVALRGSVDALAGRGAKALALLADHSPRGEAAAALVRREATARGVRVVAPGAAADRSAWMSVAGWAPTSRALAGAAQPQRRPAGHLHGVWLAPWLLSPAVVGSASGAVLPLGFDVRSPAAVDFAATLSRLLPGSAPTASGFRGWASGRPHTGTAEPAALYAATRASAMAMAPTGPEGHTAHETEVAWFPGGTVTRVSGPLT